MRCNKDSILPSAFVSIIFLYACAFGSLVPLSARYDLEAFHYGRRSIFQGFYKRADSVLDQRSLDPPVPTVELCKGQLSVAKDKAVFYSSAVEESAKAYAASIGGKTIWEAGLTDYKEALEARAKEVIDAGGESWSAEDGADFSINCSKAFALIAAGTVMAVLPSNARGDVVLPEGSYFTVHEWPILKDPNQNKNVEKVLGLVGSIDGRMPESKAQQIYPCLPRGLDDNNA